MLTGLQHSMALAKRFDSYEALFADPEIDVIYVATPHSLHLENCLSAIAHHKAVLCEKPLTTGPEDCEQLIAAARNENTYLLEAMWTHFLPAIRVALDWIEEGKNRKPHYTSRRTSAIRCFPSTRSVESTK